MQGGRGTEEAGNAGIFGGYGMLLMPLTGGSEACPGMSDTRPVIWTPRL